MRIISTKRIYQKHVEHGKRSYNQEIYINHPISQWDSLDSGVPEAEGATSVWVYPDQTNGHQYALKEWYVSHLGCVKPSFNGWIVRLLHLPGSVILKFKRVDGDSFIIVLDFDVSAVNNRIRGALHVPTPGATFAEVIDLNKANLCPPNSGQDNREQSVRTSDGILVELERDLRSTDDDSFWLRMTPP